eukprot:1062332-Amphidinium_carterae.1
MSCEKGSKTDHPTEEETTEGNLQEAEVARWRIADRGSHLWIGFTLILEGISLLRSGQAAQAPEQDQLTPGPARRPAGVPFGVIHRPQLMPLDLRREAAVQQESGEPRRWSSNPLTCSPPARRGADTHA